jgi:murein DD-endopeptidase MepM/ murein hydrolase activator NlpD
MLEKLFNKKNPDSKVQKDRDTKDAVSSLRIIAKNTLLFPTIAKELKALNNAFGNYVKLHNIEPATGSQISDITKSLSESKEIKVATIKVKKYGKEKKRTFLAGILDFFVKVLQGLFITTLLSVGYVIYKITEIISPYIEKITNIISEGISYIADGVTTFFKDVDWLDLFKTAFKKYLNFISFGLISEKQVDSALGQVGSVYKEIVKGIGGFIKSAVEWLAPKLQVIGRYVAKDILGVDVDKLIERRSVNEQLVKRSEELKKQYDDLDKQDKDLSDKRNKLFEEKSKLLKAEEDKKEAERKKKVAEAAEKEKKKPFLSRVFGKKEEVKEEPKKEEAPTPVPKKEEVKPKVDVRQVPASDGTKAPIPEPPEKKPTAEKRKEKDEKEGSGDTGMKYSDGSNVVKIISKYGMRQLPDEKQPRLHGGIDYQAAYATPITFIGSAAKVVDASAHNGYGRVVDIITNGELLRFAHLSKMLVKSGDKIEKGQTIGLVGGSSKKDGRIIEDAYGAHLHFEHRSKLSYDGKDTFDPVKTGATRMISFGDKIAATDYSISEKYANYKGDYGQGLDAESSKLALAYREQSKPQNPTYIAARSTNNNVTETRKV